MKQLTHAGLYEGIGGFSLGALRAGVKTLWTCERDNWKRERLKYNFKESKHYTDVYKLEKNIEKADILTGGFPCQDISLAGQSTGIFGDRSFLYTEMYRIASIMLPSYIIFENVSQLCKSGLEYILYDLTRIGYDAQWTTIRAEQFGYRHKRKRIFIIAYPYSKRSIQRTTHIFRSIQEVFQQNENAEQVNLSSLLKRFDRHTDKRTFSHNPRISEGLDKHTLHAVGDSVNVDIAHYLFECIKIHHKITSL
jgi:DNA (cytosine-5)-methyltransferase 1